MSPPLLVKIADPPNTRAADLLKDSSLPHGFFPFLGAAARPSSPTATVPPSCAVRPGPSRQAEPIACAARGSSLQPELCRPACRELLLGSSTSDLICRCLSAGRPQLVVAKALKQRAFGSHGVTMRPIIWRSPVFSISWRYSTALRGGRRDGIAFRWSGRATTVLQMSEIA